MSDRYSQERERGCQCLKRTWNQPSNTRVVTIFANLIMTTRWPRTSMSPTLTSHRESHYPPVPRAWSCPAVRGPHLPRHENSQPYAGPKARTSGSAPATAGCITEAGCPPPTRQHPLQSADPVLVRRAGLVCAHPAKPVCAQWVRPYVSFL